MTKNKGFTLIELLMVIAIIGILSGVILTALNNSKGKGKDGKIKAEMSSFRNAAGLYFDSAGQKYNNSGSNTSGASGCTAARTVFTDQDAASAVVGTGAVRIMTDLISLATGGLICNSNGSFSSGYHYAIQATLFDGTLWCVDETALAKKETVSIGSNWAC